MSIPGVPEVRKFEPLSSTHPLVTGKKLCPLCQEGFEVGDETCLLPKRQGPNGDARIHVVETSPTHWDCWTTALQQALNHPPE